MGVTIKGLDKALSDLDKKSDAVVQAVKTVIQETAEAIELDASNNAVRSIQIVRQLGGPFNDLNFSQRIDKVPIEGGLGANVGINIADPIFEVEAWVEFGTGLSAREILGRPQYTPEIREMAKRLFWRNGRGTLVGVPYLFPAFFKNTANLVKDIEEEIAKEIK